MGEILMNSEVVFIQKVRERRVQFSEVDRPGFYARTVLYYNAAVSYGKELQIDGAPTKKISITANKDTIQDALFDLEGLMDEIAARNLHALEPNLNLVSVKLNEDWRVKATTFISHIRETVRIAEMDEALREPIMRSLKTLQAEIDRNRTKVAAIAETWLQITQAIGAGAKNLDPAAKLMERLSKALGKAKQFEIEDQQNPQLPAPTDLDVK
jgi:hypothetical protein